MANGSTKRDSLPSNGIGNNLGNTGAPLGSHVICVRVTREFLAFSSARGNDLTTPLPQYRFAGLRPGDRWCLCALRWREALEAAVAPLVILEATHANALQFVTLAQLEKHRFQGTVH